MNPKTVTLFPERASTAALQVDTLLYFLVAVTVVMTLLVAALIVYFCVKYRRRPGDKRPPRVHGSWKLEAFWSLSPLLVMLVMFTWGAKVYFFLASPPSDAMEVYVVGRQWMWKLQHPGGQREIDELHVPVGQPVKLIMTSEDVIHSFFVPAFRIKADVLPGRYTTAWFEATKTGAFDLFCAEYCGTDHSGMTGKIVVMRPEDYQAWLSRSAEGSMALEGRKRLLQYQCVACHSADASARAPDLEGLFGRPVGLADGRTATADENYLRESILNPDAKIVAGYQPIMPSFAGQISEEELIQLIAFLKSAGPGSTPSRVDDAPPPAAEKKGPAPNAEEPERRR